MKILVGIISFLLLAMTLKAQPSFITEGSRRWNLGINSLDDGPINPYNHWKTSFLVSDGDTLVKGQWYKNIYECTDSLLNGNRLRCFIRQDSSGKVFLANHSKEMLAFDFRMKVGDTLIVNFFETENDDLKLCFIADSIGSIQLLDNKEYSARYISIYSYFRGHIGDYPIQDIWVEGIGSLMFGLVYHPIMFSTGGCCSPVLLCYYHDNQLIYINPKYNSCYIDTGVDEVNPVEKLIRLHVNNEGTLLLESSVNMGGSITFFTANGLTIARYNIDVGNNKLCLPGAGLFLYRFESATGQVQTGKVLVR